MDTKRRPKWVLALLGAMAIGLAMPVIGHAQGVTTAAVTGTVTDEQGKGVPAIQIVVTNSATGATSGVLTRPDGRYLLPGLQPGAYRIEARGLGYATEVRENVTLALGQTARFDFALATQAVALEGIEVTGQRNDVISKGRTGAATVVGQQTVENMPTLNRDFTSLTRLAPQISTSGNATNAAGRHSKFNNIQIDGAANNDLFGLGSGGTPGNDVGAKPISIEAIQEFQVVIAPFDVRQGGFTGAGVNAITKSGTNEFHGSLSYFGRNQDFAGRYVTVGGDKSAKLGDFTDQGGAFSLGGPILKDKLHFFVAGEKNERDSPNGGLAVGRNGTLTTEHVQPIVDYVKSTHGFDPGAIGEVTMNQFSNNLFGRLDYQINPDHRLTVRHNWVKAGDYNLTRSTSLYMLGDAGYAKESVTNSTVAQLNSNFGGRFFNELRVGRTAIHDERKVPVAFPFVSIQIPNNPNVALGSENFSPANDLTQDVWELTNDLTFTSGRHTFTVGTHNEFFEFTNLFVRNPYGNYTFASFDDFKAGKPNRYEHSFLLPGGNERAAFAVRQYSFYAQDQFDITDNLRLTAGVRYDITSMPDRPTQNDSVTHYFGRRTDEVPSNNGLFNPRLGFNWDVRGDQSTQLRGGIGYFSGRTPYVYISNAYGNTGADYASFTCSGAATPAFEPDITKQPQSCAGTTSFPKGTINLTDKDFRFPQVLRTTFGVDQQLPYGFIGTLEGIYTKTIHDVLYQELTVGAPAGTLLGRTTYSRNLNGYSSITDVTNTDQGYTYSITGQLQRRFADGWDGSLAYTYGQAWEVTGLSSSQAYSNWRYNPIKDDPNNPDLRPSNFDVRHRIVANGTKEFEFARNAPTTLSVIYIGESGRPYSYTYNGSDINNDGSRDNDLFFVPADASQIQFEPFRAPGTNNANDRGQPFTPEQSWANLNSFIESVSCLRESRGKVVERNACRLPWSNQFDVRLSQAIPSVRGHKLDLNLDIINFANLVNKDWGKSRFVSNQNDVIIRATNINHANQTATFEGYAPRKDAYQVSDLGSRYQIQLGLRYAF
jgi:outer membrane receptor protein involved in Fe transport